MILKNTWANGKDKWVVVQRSALSAITENCTIWNPGRSGFLEEVTLELSCKWQIEICPGVKDLLGRGNKCKGVGTGNHGALGETQSAPSGDCGFWDGNGTCETGPGLSVPVNGTGFHFCIPSPPCLLIWHFATLPFFLLYTRDSA